MICKITHLNFNRPKLALLAIKHAHLLSLFNFFNIPNTFSSKFKTFSHIYILYEKNIILPVLSFINHSSYIIYFLFFCIIYIFQIIFNPII